MIINTMSQQIIDFASNLNVDYIKGTEAEIQLPLKRFPDSSISSLILVGWCEEGHPATKNLLQHSHE